MIENDCSNCKYAKIGGAGKTIRTHGNSIFIMQVSGSTHCTKGTIKNLTITDGKMICSEYEPKEGVNNE